MQANFNDEAATALPPPTTSSPEAYLFEQDPRYIVTSESGAATCEPARSPDPTIGYPSWNVSPHPEGLLAHLEARLTRPAPANAARPVLFFLSIDEFTAVCNSLGYAQGNHLLTVTEQRLLACLEPGDLLTRWGSDAFAIVIDRPYNQRQVVQLAEQMQHDLAAPLVLDGCELCSSASIGIVFATNHECQPALLLRDAMTAMHHARSLGAGQVRIFQPAMRTRTLNRLRLKAELRRAIVQHELDVFYQPIVNLDDGEIIGFEALVRWHHPQRGLLRPDTFVPLAEETGLIVPLSLWVLRAACQQMCRWHARFPELRHLTLNVNLSVRALAHPGLADEVARILDETGFGAAFLKLELTESMLIDHSEQTITALERLRELGIQLCIDDFGTGYSALHYLARLPVQTLKIDRSFLADVDDTARQQTIMQGIVTIGHALGLQLVAEGIETRAQYAALRELHCDYGQGYLFSRPVNGTEAEALIARRHAAT